MWSRLWRYEPSFPISHKAIIIHVFSPWLINRGLWLTSMFLGFPQRWHPWISPLERNGVWPCRSVPCVKAMMKTRRLTVSVGAVTILSAASWDVSWPHEMTRHVLVDDYEICIRTWKRCLVEMFGQVPVIRAKHVFWLKKIHFIEFTFEFTPYVVTTMFDTFMSKNLAQTRPLCGYQSLRLSSLSRIIQQIIYQDTTKDLVVFW